MKKFFSLVLESPLHSVVARLHGVRAYKMGEKLVHITENHSMYQSKNLGTLDDLARKKPRVHQSDEETPARWRCCPCNASVQGSHKKRCEIAMGEKLERLNGAVITLADGFIVKQ